MELWNKSPHFTWNSWPQPRIWPRSSLIYGEGTWQKPPGWVWPCRPWWTWPKMIKFAWKYAVVHYSKLPCPKNTRKFWSNFFSSQNFHFFRGCKNGIWTDSMNEIIHISAENCFIITNSKGNWSRQTYLFTEEI